MHFLKAEKDFPFVIWTYVVQRIVDSNTNKRCHSTVQYCIASPGMVCRARVSVERVFFTCAVVHDEIGQRTSFVW